MMGLVVAMTQHERERYNEIDNFWSKIRYAIDKGLFLFTSWGQANCCATDADGICDHTGDYVGYDEVWTYGTERIDCTDFCSYDKCAIDSWGDKICLGGKCPQPTYSDYNDYIGEENGVGAYFRGDEINMWYFSEIYCCPQSCPIEPEEHDTKAYDCDDGEWDYKGRYDYDEYCSYAGSGNDYKCWCADEDDNFYIDLHGGVHCRSSPKDSWCVEFEEHSYFLCYNNDLWWFDNSKYNRRNDKYEECEYGCIDDAEVCKSAPNGNGIEKDCEELGGKCYIAVCPSNKESIGDKGCGILSTCCVEKNGNGLPEEKETITWTEYYSIDSETLVSKNIFCDTDSQCPAKKGYDVTCSSESKIEERIQGFYKGECDKVGGLVGKLSRLITKWGVGIDICEYVGQAGGFLSSVFKGDGICMAESTTWYGKLWEKALKTVGGFGLPAQYVVIITILFLITLLALLIKFIPIRR